MSAEVGVSAAVWFFLAVGNKKEEKEKSFLSKVRCLSLLFGRVMSLLQVRNEGGVGRGGMPT